MMTAFDLFSIGHSNIPVDRFIALLRDTGADAVADVRSAPYSRFFPWFSRKNLETRLAAEGMAYLLCGETLGGRPHDHSLYRDGIADYEGMARRDEFRGGLAQLQSAASQRRVCLMCAEREPLDCHRCLLFARALAERGLAIGHILHNGTIEPHDATEQRLMTWAGDATANDLFVTGQSERLAAAYRRRARAVAYRAKQGSSGAKTGVEAK